MANSFWVPTSTPDSFATSVGMPGAAPVPGGTLMTGNPNPGGLQDNCLGTEPGTPQNPVQQLTATQLSSGLIPTNLQPTTVLQGAGPANQGGNAGGDSLMAQLSRGQVLLCDSTYGQSGFIPQNGGASPQAVAPAANITQPSTARVANVVTYAANNPNLSGM
jgi:hypothetical protein